MKLAENLKCLKLVMWTWNKVVFGWMGDHIKHLEAKLEDGEDCSKEVYFEEVETNVLASKIELVTWLQRKESRLSQHVKQSWVADGEFPASFFKALQS